MMDHHQARTGMSPAPARTRLPMAELERFMMEGLPVAAIAHSFHVEALTDPRVQADPAFQQFSMIELNELHHQVAALGAHLRHMMGDPTAMQSLGLNLAGFLQNRQTAMQMVPRFAPTTVQNPAVQVMMGLTEVSNEQVAQNWPVLTQALAATRAPVPGPMLVGRLPQ